VKKERRTKKYIWICSEVSVNSPGIHQSRRRKGGYSGGRFAEKEGFKGFGMKE